MRQSQGSNCESGKVRAAGLGLSMLGNRGNRGNQGHLFLALLYALFLLILPTGGAIHGQAEELEQARRLLELSQEEAIEQIGKLDEQRALELSSQMRFLLRDRNPDIDRIYWLLRHIEGLRADRLAEQRLYNLLWVIGLTLLLFSAFLISTIYRQHQSFRKLQMMYASQAAQKKEAAAEKRSKKNGKGEYSEKAVYRGE